MKKKPWHSDQQSTEVYHNDTNCNTGNNIEKENLARGKNGRRLCKECKRLH